jgi:16S rRNA processing protein RimM
LTSSPRLVTVGRVGRAHGRDGSFWVEDALLEDDDGPDPLGVGTEVFVAERAGRVERRAGTSARPLLRLDSITDRDAAGAVRGRELRVAETDAPLAPGEWLIDDLLGARVEGIGEVRRVLAAPSCDLLEVGDDAVLIPLVSDAIRRIDVAEGVIEVDRRFLGVDAATAEPERPAADPAAGTGTDSSPEVPTRT